MNDKAKANSIFKRNIADCGSDRDTYQATLEEIQIFIKGGGKIVHLNKDNNDGSCSHKVKFKNKFFIACTTKDEKI